MGVSKDQLAELGTVVQALLDGLDAVKEDLFDASKLLGEQDFTHYPRRLSELQKQIASLSDYVNKLREGCDWADANAFLGALEEYVLTLQDSIVDLKQIAKRLEEKSKGKKYGWFEYRRDVKRFERTNQDRSREGQRLNRLYQACLR